jgi:RHS repeat-associated protein
VFGATLTGPSANAWQFTGEQRDADSSLYYLRARYHDPATGRFLSADPLAGAPTQPQTMNRYVYALNNPVNRVDPTGLASEGPMLLTSNLSSLLGELIVGQSCTGAAVGLFIALAMTVFMLAPPSGGGLINPVNIQVAGFFGAMAVWNGIRVTQNCDFS